MLDSHNLLLTFTLNAIELEHYGDILGREDWIKYFLDISQKKKDFFPQLHYCTLYFQNLLFIDCIFKLSCHRK